MSVHVTFLGRLGNNLFSYALGRILAEELDLALICHSLPLASPSIGGIEMDVGSDASLEALGAFFPNAPLQIPGRTFCEPIDSFEIGVAPAEWRGQTIDLGKILGNKDPRQIRLKGWFQRFEYYASRSNQIRHWLRPREIPCPYRVNPTDVLVSIRRGADYGNKQWTLPLSYYEQVLSSFGTLGQVYICGTCIDDVTKECLKRFQPIYFHGSPMEHFSFFMKFKRIVLSNSTFSWWGAFISEAEEIYAPRFEGISAYCFTGFEEVDLDLREPRYKEIAVKSVARFALFRRNEKTIVTLNQTEGRCVVKSENAAYEFGVSPIQSKLISWILYQDSPITLASVLEMCRYQDAKRTVDLLVSTGLLQICPTYLD